ncbi:2OG-Fe dioxygenase family protein [Microbacterium sp. GCS4]|uniref:2OG-Fe dioxygenase family protein n=1 Tax=Microbacterium sp. GCS4 TaxID=1692239 RepID=UPI00137926E6|nr:2OG-Fe dioxygenase family protein [Microbacterium sp. GCS4]
MTNVSDAQNVASLRTKGYAHSKLDLASDWELFAESWDNLRPDTYMADGGEYRVRRYSEFSVNGTTGAANLLPHVAYRQERDVNHLNGGIDRLYEPFESRVVDSDALARAFATSAAYLEAVRPGRTWKAQCFQNRIMSTPNEIGHPAPEGVHRDGVDFVLTLFVDRVGAQGGVSSVYTLRTRACWQKRSWRSPENTSSSTIRKLMHGVTGLSLEEGQEIGHRDVLIAMFTVVED